MHDRHAVLYGHIVVITNVVQVILNVESCRLLLGYGQQRYILKHKTKISVVAFTVVNINKACMLTVKIIMDINIHHSPDHVDFVCLYLSGEEQLPVSDKMTVQVTKLVKTIFRNLGVFYLIFFFCCHCTCYMGVV